MAVAILTTVFVKNLVNVRFGSLADSTEHSQQRRGAIRFRCRGRSAISFVCEREYSISSDSSRDTADTHIRTTAGMSRIRIHSSRSTRVGTRADVPCD
jgi:hypothetical protein